MFVSHQIVESFRLLSWTPHRGLCMPPSTAHAHSPSTVTWPAISRDNNTAKGYTDLALWRHWCYWNDMLMWEYDGTVTETMWSPSMMASQKTYGPRVIESETMWSSDTMTSQFLRRYDHVPLWRHWHHTQSLELCGHPASPRHRRVEKSNRTPEKCGKYCHNLTWSTVQSMTGHHTSHTLRAGLLVVCDLCGSNKD